MVSFIGETNAPRFESIQFFTFVRTTVAKLPMVGVIKEIQNQIS